MEFVLKIETALKEMNYEKAALEVLNPNNLPYIHAEGMELIGKLCDIGLQAAVELDDVSTCSEVLNYICSCYNPKLALVSTLEQAETFMRSPKFGIIMKAILIVFHRHQSKRAATYSWTLDLFQKHLQEFHKFPERLKNKLNEGHETMLVENDSKVRSMFSYYSDLYHFYQPVVDDFQAKSQVPPADEEGKNELGKLERTLQCSLVNTLGVPFIYFDLTAPDVDCNSSGTPHKSRGLLQLKKPHIGSKSKSEARVIAERIMGQICQVSMDYSFFLKWTELKCLPQPELTELDEVEYDEGVEEVDFQKTAIANYFYLVYAENLNPGQRQTPYTATHRFTVLLALVNALLLEQKQNYLTIEKGLMLAQALICELTEPLNADCLTGEVDVAFLEKLTQLVVYFDVRSTRGMTLNVLKSYFWKFDPAGKYSFFQFIVAKGCHPGLVGYMIGQVKDCIAITLDKKQANLGEMECQFNGPSLAKILLQICTLKDGVTTDLLAMNDQIISTLNLLRFLLLRDGIANKTGILDSMSNIERNMLRPLRSALDLTKSHCEQRLKEMQDPEYKRNNNEGNPDEAKVTSNVLVDGQELELDGMSIEDQINGLRQGLCSIDIMESILARVNECYGSVMKA